MSRTRQTTSVCCFPSTSSVIGGAREGKGVLPIPAREHTLVGGLELSIPSQVLISYPSIWGSLPSVLPPTINLSYPPIHPSLLAFTHLTTFLPSILSTIIRLPTSLLSAFNLYVSIHPFIHLPFLPFIYASFRHLSVTSESLCQALGTQQLIKILSLLSMISIPWERPQMKTNTYSALLCGPQERGSLWGGKEGGRIWNEIKGTSNALHLFVSFKDIWFKCGNILTIC